MYDNTGSTAPLYDLATDLDLVNTMYAPHGIQFNFCVEEVQNQNWLVNPAFGFLRATCPNQHNYIDLLVNTDAGVGGGEALSRVSGEVATRVWALNGVYQIAHELGHAMGLHHTFYDSVNFGDDGDLIDDTPFHVCDNDALFSSSVQFSFAANPLNWEVDGNGNSVCEIVWENIRDNDGNGTPYPANHDSDNVLYNNVMSELHTDVSPACPATGRTWVFTDGQGQRMPSNINTYLTDYIGSANTCPEDPAILTGSLSSNVSYSNEILLIEGNVIIAAEVTFDNCYFVVEAGSSLSVSNGAKLYVYDSFFGQCQGTEWTGIEVAEGGFIDIRESKIYNASTGIDIASNATENGELSIIEKVEFRGCPTSINVTGVGENSDDPDLLLDLSDIEVYRSKVNIVDSGVFISGGIYDATVVECTNSAVFTRTATTRPSFFQGSILYNSGKRLQIDETNFSFANNVCVDVKSCDYLTICRSILNPQSNINPLVVNETKKIDIFLNQFTGYSSDDLMHLQSGTYGNATNPDQVEGSFIRDNMFTGGKSQIRLSSASADLTIRCNTHEEYESAWNLDQSGSIKDQGDQFNGADNLFKDGEDINNANSKFDYFYSQDFGPQGGFLIPDIVTNVDVINSSGTPGERCQDDILGEVIGEWEEYFTCASNPDPTVICCDNYVPPTPTYPEDYECIICPPDPDPDPNGGGSGDGGRALDNDINIALHQNTQHKIEQQRIDYRSISSNTILYSPNPVGNQLNLVYPESITGSKLFVYNSAGILVIGCPLHKEINVSALPSGLYFAVIRDFENNILNIQSIVKD